MIVLAIDPGYERLGIAVIEKKQKEALLFSECFQTKKALSHPQRLRLIGERVTEIIEKWKPEALAIENLFLTQNQKTAMQVSETRGVILYEAAKQNMEVREFSPPQIKLAVCGNGRADKKALIKMIPLLLKVEKKVDFDDEFDAMAVGLTYFAIKKGF